MQNDLISVIIPCYNLDRYLEKCMDSILGQTYSHLEVIAIDDGSTDRTPELLEQYVRKDSRITSVCQTNAGAGAAMNQGIRLARGEFLAFVDNDDWLELDMYEKLYRAITASGADIAVCNFNMDYGDHRTFCYSDMRDEVVPVQGNIYSYFLRYCACEKPNNYVWTRLYRTGMVKQADVRFENLSLGADTLFNFKLLPHINRAAFIRDGLYNYVQRNDSSVYTMAKRRNIAAVYADGFDALADYYTARNVGEAARILPVHAATRLRSTVFYSRLAGLPDEEIEKNIREGFRDRRIADYLAEGSI